MRVLETRPTQYFRALLVPHRFPLSKPNRPTHREQFCVTTRLWMTSSTRAHLQNLVGALRTFSVGGSCSSQGDYCSPNQGATVRDFIEETADILLEVVNSWIGIPACREGVGKSGGRGC